MKYPLTALVIFLTMGSGLRAWAVTSSTATDPNDQKVPKAIFLQKGAKLDFEAGEPALDPVEAQLRMVLGDIEITDPRPPEAEKK